jgi:hypothetical protein
MEEIVLLVIHEPYGWRSWYSVWMKERIYLDPVITLL